jgi:hypothetical protein
VLNSPVQWQSKYLLTTASPGCQAIKSRKTDPFSSGELVSIPARSSCALVPFHNKNLATCWWHLRKLPHSFAVCTVQTPGTLFARSLLITLYLPNEDAIDKRSHFQQIKKEN